MAQKKDLPADKLFYFFQYQFLEVSAKLVLLGDINKIVIVGNGTPVETVVYPRSKPS